MPLCAADASLADAVQRQDSAATVRLLSSARSLVNVAQADGTTALQWAAHWNDASMVVALIRAGADVNATNRYGVSPLVVASGIGTGVAVIDALLKREGRRPPRAFIFVNIAGTDLQ
jgi:ankyrin repeat protein